MHTSAKATEGPTTVKGLENNFADYLTAYIANETFIHMIPYKPTDNLDAQMQDHEHVEHGSNLTDNNCREKI